MFPSWIRKPVYGNVHLFPALCCLTSSAIPWLVERCFLRLCVRILLLPVPSLPTLSLHHPLVDKRRWKIIRHKDEGTRGDGSLALIRFTCRPFFSQFDEGATFTHHGKHGKGSSHLWILPLPYPSLCSVIMFVSRERQERDHKHKTTIWKKNCFTVYWFCPVKCINDTVEDHRWQKDEAIQAVGDLKIMYYVYQGLYRVDS